MPNSSPNNKPVTQFIIRREFKQKGLPYSVLDIGIGWGDIGREIKRIDKGIEIEGIEAFPAYKNDSPAIAEQWALYKNIYLGDAMEVMPTLNRKYDSIVFIDVLEHFNREDGIKMLRMCEETADHIIISCPIVDYIQDVIRDNPYEIHRTQWKIHELEAQGYTNVYFDDVIGIFEWKRALA